MKKTIWQPPVLGVVLGLLAGVTLVAGLSFLTDGITNNSIGLYAALFLLAAALGGPLAGAIASTLLVISSALYGPPDVQAIAADPINFWSNTLALGISVALVGFAYRLIFERLKMPTRLLAWAGIVIAYYAVMVPSSIIPQYLLHGDPRSEILPAVWEAYVIYLPQAIFDIFMTSLVFVALPLSLARPRWYEPKQVSTPEERSGNSLTFSNR